MIVDLDFLNQFSGFDDMSKTVFWFQLKCYGGELLRQVAERINLLEVDYFDLEFLDEDNTPVNLLTCF